MSAQNNATQEVQGLQPDALAAAIAGHFQSYNEAFGQITRRAALHFASCDWALGRQDAMARIELYEQRVSACAAVVAATLGDASRQAALWMQIKQAFEALVRRRPDAHFYRTFFNSITRDLFATVGVNAEVEFCAPSPTRAAGSVALRIYPIAGSIQGCVQEILADLPFVGAVSRPEEAVRRITTEIGRHFHGRPQSAAPECIELIEPVFYRGTHASIVGRLIGDSAMTPLVIEFSHAPDGVRVENVLMARNDIGLFFGFARSYFQVDLPVVGAAVTLLRSFMPRKPIDELYTVLGRAKQGKTERYFALRRHLDASIDTFVHAPGERGLVMIVFTLPSHDLVFKVIRDRFGAPKNSTREEVMERYQWVFRHERADRLVDAQEFRRLRLPRARFMPGLVEELLSQASQSCRVEGEDLIVEHCYIERRLRPLDLYLRETDPAAAEAAIIDYGAALRDLAVNNIFPGDLLLKNFGVTHSGRVIFYDYDELCEVSDCLFRELPSPRSDEEETSAEPWFYVGEHDVFPEQWLPFLSMSDPLREVFLRHHAEILTAAWWRERQREQAAAALAAAPARPALAAPLPCPSAA